jgi:hypothetical protein
LRGLIRKRTRFAKEIYRRDSFLFLTENGHDD